MSPRLRVTSEERISLLAEALRLGVRIEQTMRAYFAGEVTPLEAGMRTLAASRDAAGEEQRALLEKLAPGDAGALARRVASLQPELFAQADGLDRERNHFIKSFRSRYGREITDPAVKRSFDEAMQEFNRRKDDLFREAAETFLRTTPEQQA